jgi:hypothetical protein
VAAILSAIFFILGGMWFLLWLCSRWSARSDLLMAGRYSLGRYDPEKERQATRDGYAEQKRIIEWIRPKWRLAVAFLCIGAVFLVVALAT